MATGGDEREGGGVVAYRTYAEMVENAHDVDGWHGPSPRCPGSVGGGGRGGDDPAAAGGADVSGGEETAVRDLATVVGKLSGGARRAAREARYVPTPGNGIGTWARVDGLAPMCPFGVALSADGLLSMAAGVRCAARPGRAEVNPWTQITAFLVGRALSLTREEEDGVERFMVAWDRGEVDGAGLREAFADPDPAGAS